MMMRGPAPPRRPQGPTRWLWVRAAAGFALAVAATTSVADCADDAIHAAGPPPVAGIRPTGEPQKITRMVSGILFDSAYDNGSLADVTLAEPDVFDCELYEETGELGSRRYWFRFGMTGTAGRTITLRIDHGASPRPAIRIGDEPWRRTTSAEAPFTDRLVLTFDADEDEAEVAFFYPFGVTETYEEVEGIVAASPHAEISSMGTSTQGRDLWMVTITDRSVPDEGKRRVWLHARAHAGEVTATHVMLGFLEGATADTEAGRTLRARCILNVMPVLNIDGVYLGHTRWDSLGIDPEREWCNIRIPEVAAIRAKVDGFMAGPNPVEVALNLHSTQQDQTDTFFFKHLVPSVSSEFEEIQQAWIDAFDHATPLFDNLNPGTSQLAACSFIESYFWSNWAESVMALTYEGHFRRRITDGDWITDADYRALGRAMAGALHEYFALAPFPPQARLDVY